MRIFRGVTKLEGKQVSKEALTHIRAVPHMKTQDELDAFKTYCDTSTEKAVRGMLVYINDLSQLEEIKP